MTGEHVQPSRRQVLCGVMVALVAPGVLAACSASPAGSTTPTTNPGTSGGGGNPGGAVAKLADVKVGSGKLVPWPGKSGLLLLVRPSDAEIKAYDPTCPHQGTSVEPPVAGVITCPNHHSQFDAATGALKRGPATTGLTAVAVKIDGANIVLA